MCVCVCNSIRDTHCLSVSPLAVQGTVKEVVKEVAASELAELPRSRRPGLWAGMNA